MWSKEKGIMATSSLAYLLSFQAEKCKTGHSREDLYSPASNCREDPGGQVSGGVYGVARVHPQPQADAQDQDTSEQGLRAFQGSVVFLIMNDQNAQEQHQRRQKLQEQEEQIRREKKARMVTLSREEETSQNGRAGGIRGLIKSGRTPLVFPPHR